MTEYDALADLYDAEWQELTDDIPFLMSLASTTGGPALDLAAGTGRVTFPLAEAGLEVVGMDNSAAMLQRAAQRLQTRYAHVASRVQFMTGDMAQFQTGRQFRFICITQNSFLLLTRREDMDSCLQSVREQLHPEGVFVVDIYSPRFELIGDRNNTIRFLRHFYLPEQETVVLQWEYVVRDMALQVMDIDFLYELYDHKGVLTRRTHSLHMSIMFRYEMQYLLEKQGFLVEQVLGDYAGGPFTAESPQMIFICRRGGPRIS